MSKPRPSHISVVGVDFEADGNIALDAAIRLAANDPHAEVHALFVANTFDASIDGRTEHYTSNALDRLEALLAERFESIKKANPAIRFRRLVTHFRLGSPAEQIVQLSVDLDADLIVVGTHNRKGLKRLVLGSVAERVAHLARCPVLIVRPKNHENLGDVPEIEPPCPNCVATQKESNGERLWCARHEQAKYHPRPHRYTYTYGPHLVSHGGAEGWGRQ